VTASVRRPGAHPPLNPTLRSSSCCLLATSKAESVGLVSVCLGGSDASVGREKSCSCSCSLAVLDPRVGHTMDVLSTFIPVLCHSD